MGEGESETPILLNYYVAPVVVSRLVPLEVAASSPCCGRASPSTSAT